MESERGRGWRAGLVTTHPSEDAPTLGMLTPVSLSHSGGSLEKTVLNRKYTTPLIPTSLIVEDQNVLTSDSCHLSKKQALASSNLSITIMADCPKVSQRSPLCLESSRVDSCFSPSPQLRATSWLWQHSLRSQSSHLSPQHPTCIGLSLLKDTHVPRHQEPKGLVTLSTLRDKHASSLGLLPALTDSRV